MNTVAMWVGSCLAAAGLGLAGGLWLAGYWRAHKTQSSNDTAMLAALQLQIKNLLEAQGLAIAGAHRTARDEYARMSERQPLLLQRALEVELTRYAALQARRDNAAAAQLAELRNAQQRGFEDLIKTLRAVRAQDVPASTQAIAASIVRTAPVHTPAGISPRPPELLLTPIKLPTPSAEPEPTARELSDAELDAMPPDLPPIRPHRRLLPTPKAPPMGRL